MLRPPRIVVTATTLLFVSLSTACSGTSYSHEESDTAPKSATVDPVDACAALVTSPSGMTQQKAAELGCVEVGEHKWEHQSSSARVDPAPPVESQPGGGIPWNEAINHAGTSQRVCGPLAGGGNSGDDVFLNLGLDYPDSGRFQIVIWDIGSLEPIAGGGTLCTSGPITLYKGVPQIELLDPALIDIYE